LGQLVPEAFIGRLSLQGCRTERKKTKKKSTAVTTESVFPRTARPFVAIESSRTVAILGNGCG
jgi:hypothetical protein